MDDAVARMGSLARDYGLDFDGVQRPAHRVGGDFLDLFALDDERLCIVLGDVSDKGAAAARIALRLRGALRQNMRRDENPARALQAMNRQMFNAAEGTQFATLALLIWQADGHVTYVNAGHLPPMVR
ncbi:MAG: SpoIIE family protein phosphatase, partial [Pseudomonadota bacterium]